METVSADFYTAGGEFAGSVMLVAFTKNGVQNPEKYLLLQCSTSSNTFPTAPPSEINKVWTIALTRLSGDIRLVVQCNDIEVLNVVLSDTTCKSSDWRTYWSRDVEQISFGDSDDASDYYRPGK